MNTLSLIVTLTIFLANGSMSKNLNRKPTISAPHHPAPGLNGAGINPNAKPFLKIERIDAPKILQPTIHAMPGANGSGINPNSKISTDIKPMAPMPAPKPMGPMPKAEFATPSYAPEEVNAPLAPETVTRIKVDGDHADLPPINEEVVHDYAEKEVMAPEQEEEIEMAPMKPMAPMPKIKSTFATPSYAPEEVNAPLAPETVTRIKVDGDHADLPPIDEEVVHDYAEEEVKAEECQCFSSTREEGEAVCEGHGFDVNQCLQHEACHWGPVENEQCQNEAAAVEMAPMKPMAPSRSAMKLP